MKNIIKTVKAKAKSINLAIMVEITRIERGKYILRISGAEFTSDIADEVTEVEKRFQGRRAVYRNKV